MKSFHLGSYDQIGNTLNLIICKIMKVLHYILLLLIFIMPSCKDDDFRQQNDYNYYPLSEKLYPFLFDQGSYWVYNSPDTNAIDSIRVGHIQMKNYHLSPNLPGTGSPGETDYYEVKYNSSIRGEIYEKVIIRYITRGSLNGGYIYLPSLDIGDSLVNAVVANIYDSLIVNDTVYHNVTKMRIHEDFYIPQDMNFYFVDSIGIVKKEIVKNFNVTETWNLLKYNVTIHEVN